MLQQDNYAIVESINCKAWWYEMLTNDTSSKKATSVRSFPLSERPAKRLKWELAGMEIFEEAPRLRNGFDYAVPNTALDNSFESFREVLDHVVPGISMLRSSAEIGNETELDQCSSSEPLVPSITVTSEDGHTDNAEFALATRPDSPRPNQTSWETLTPPSRRRTSVFAVAGKWGCSLQDAAEMMAAVESAQTVPDACPSLEGIAEDEDE